MWFWFIEFTGVDFFCGGKGVYHLGFFFPFIWDEILSSIERREKKFPFSSFIKNMLFLFLQRKKRRGIRIFYDQEIQPFRIQDSDTKYHSVQYCYRSRFTSEVIKQSILNFLSLHFINEYLCTVTISDFNIFFFSVLKERLLQVVLKIWWNAWKKLLVWNFWDRELNILLKTYYKINSNTKMSLKLLKRVLQRMISAVQTLWNLWYNICMYLYIL